MKLSLTCLFTSLIFCIHTFAGIVRVPEDQATIQDGINVATDGDVVLVNNGTYYENINFKGKAITVASHYLVDNDTTHISSTIINGSQHSHPDSGSVVYFISGEDTNSVLYGFTITGGSGTVAHLLPYAEGRDGGGILVLHSGAKIEKNTIIANHITTTGDTSAGCVGIAVMGDAGDYVVINDNDIIQNTATATDNQAGATVCLITKDTCLFENNRVSNNVSNGTSALAGGLWIDGQLHHNGHYIIRNNIISDNILNAPGSGGGGVYIQNCSPILTNNIISNNACGSWGGGGIRVYHWTAATGIPEPILINNTITNNSTTGGGGGIFVRGPQADVKVMNTILWDNSAARGKQIHYLDGGRIAVRYSNIEGSWPGEDNIDADPQFAAGDPLFHLTPDPLNPCINTGTDALQINGQWYYCPPEDFEGDERPYMGTAADIGADETQVEPVGVEPQPRAGIPHSYSLEQNYPNPFNPSTTIEFALPKAGFVTLIIYNVAGEKVTTPISEKLAAGSYEYQWDARGLASGVYYYRLEAGHGFTQTKKMLLIK